MSTVLAQVSDLPTMGAHERGGPRYVQVASQGPTQCHRCRRTIPVGEAHAYDRVRGFGRPPRRWCAACWAADPQPQVLR